MRLVPALATVVALCNAVGLTSLTFCEGGAEEDEA
jgi:hypothetical protein